MDNPEHVTNDNLQENIFFLRRGSDKSSRVEKDEHSETQSSSHQNSANNQSLSINEKLEGKPDGSSPSSPLKMIDKESTGSIKEKRLSESSSISEQIEKQESVDESHIEQYSNQLHEVSIPSLNLLSLTRTDSEYEESYAHSGIVESKHSSSTLLGIFSEDKEEEHSKTEENESKKITPDLSWKIDGPAENENISNESSIHTQFDWTDISNSSKNISIGNSSHADAKDMSGTPSLKKKKKSPRRISQLYPDALATDPPLQTNADLKIKNVQKSSSSSEEVVKLDIRGHASANRQFPFVSKVFFPSVESIPTPVLENDFIALNEKVVNLASLQNISALVSPENNVNRIEEASNLGYKKKSSIFIENVKSSDIEYEQDYAVEELILNESRDRFPCKDKEENVYNLNMLNKPPEGESSMSTVATDYKTLCDDFNHKIPDFHAALTQRENLIEELKASLKQSVEDRDQLQFQNKHLTSELGKMQMLLSDATSLGSEMKGHLSDFVKHENFTRESDVECFPLPVKYFENRCENCLQDINDKKSNNITEIGILPENIKSLEAMKVFCNLTNSFRPSDQFLSDYENFFDEMKPDHSEVEQKSNEKLLKLLEKELQTKSEMIFSYTKSIVDRINYDRGVLETETSRLRDLLLSVKSNNPSILDLRKELENKYCREMENLRTYFQQKCSNIEKCYSEEVFSQQSKKMSAASSADSLNNCPEAMPFGSPFHSAGDRAEQNRKKLERSHSADFCLGTTNEPSYLEEKMKCMKAEHRDQIKILTSQHDSYIRDLISSHESYMMRVENDHKEQIADLKAHLQTLENTEIHGDLLHFEHRDTDLELEKDSEALMEKQGSVIGNQEELEKIHNLPNETEALLSDPNAEITNWPLELIALRDKLQADAQHMFEELKMTHAQELSALRDENSKQIAVVNDKYQTESEKWKQKRNDAFDKNRCLAETIKERDGLKHMTRTLQKVLSQLVEYFNLCEDELNNTFVGELLKQIILADENFDNTIVLSSFSTTKVDPNHSLNNVTEDFDPNSTAVSQIDTKCKRMHFAPNVNGIMTFIDTDTILDCIDQSQDISINFKHDLDTCLQRLRTDAQEILVMSSSRIASKRLSILGSNNDEEKIPNTSIDKNESISEKILDSIDVKSVHPSYDDLQDLYKSSEIGRKELEESLAQSMHQEVVLRQELQMAMDKIGELMTDNPLDHTREIISEGYGIVQHPRTPISLPPHPRLAITSPPPLLASEGNTPEGRSLSLDGGTDKRLSEIQELARRLTCELEAATREKEDKHMQLEAANKQLRSTRQFLEEQAAEREQERDDFQRQLELLKDDKTKLVSKAQQHANMCKESETTQSALPHSQVYVEQQDQQMREMTTLISDLEAQKHTSESELTSYQEKILMLRDIIANIEYKLETKTCSEVQILKELDSFKVLIEEKESKVKILCQELESLKKQLGDKIAEEVLAAGHCGLDNVDKSNDLEMEKKLVEQMRSQLNSLVDTIAVHTVALENLHEAVCSQSCSSPSEDVSVRDHRKQDEMDNNEESHQITSTSPTKLVLELPVLEMSQLGDSLHRHLKAEDAALKRIRDLEMQLVKLKDVAQELRTERDILQERMSEQSLRISSLQSKLDRTRNTAEALRHQSTEDLRLQRDEALSEVQLLKESLDSRDKQVARLKALIESTKKRLVDQEQELTSCAGSSKETIQRLRRDLREQQSKVRELQDALESNRLHQDSIPGFLESVVADKNADIDILRQQLLEKEKHLQAVLSIRLDDEVLKHLSNSDKDVNNEGKLSARTLSDILSISEFDEPDVIRKAELCRPQSFMSGQLIMSSNNMKDQNATNLPEDEELAAALNNALQITQIHDKSTHLLQDVSPESDQQHSLPELENSPLQKDNEGFLNRYKRNVNETTGFGLSLNVDNDKMVSNVLSDNCSMFPNKDASGDRNNSVEPKRIDFSVANLSNDVNKNHTELKGEESTPALHSVSVVLEKSNFEQSEKNDIKSLRDLGIQVDLEQKLYPDILTQLKHEISILQDELEVKKSALKMAEEQLSEFPLVKSEVDELKQILQNSLQTMEQDKQYYSNQLDTFAIGEKILKQKLEETIFESNEKGKELQTLKEDIVRRENIVLELAKEKRNLQRLLLETEEKFQSLLTNENMLQSNSVENTRLKEKSNELEKLLTEKNLQIDNLNENLDQLDHLQGKLNEKMEQIGQLEQQNRSLQDTENHLKQSNSELIFEVKKLTERNFEVQSENSKIKEDLSKLELELENNSQLEQSLSQRNLQSCPGDADFEGLRKLEEFNSLLREFYYPNSPVGESGERLYGNEQWNFEKIRKRISSLHYDLNEKRNTLSLKVLELERAKLEVNDMKMQMDHLKNYVSEKDSVLNNIILERNDLQDKLKDIMDKLREEGNVDDLREKLIRKSEDFTVLEGEVASLRQEIQRSHHDSLSDRERDDRLKEVSIENGRLKQQLVTLEMRLSDQETLIRELNGVRENLMTDLETLEQNSEVEKDTSARLQLLLETEKQTSSNIQCQDSNVIQILRGRLEVALDSESELKMLLEREKLNGEQLQKNLEKLKKQFENLKAKSGSDEVTSDSGIGLQVKLDNANAQIEDQAEITELLKSEVMLLKTKFDREKGRLVDLQNVLDREKLWFQKEIDASKEQVKTYKSELAEMKRQKHEMHLELVHSRERLHLQKNEVSSLEKKLSSLQESQRGIDKSDSYKLLLCELEQQKTDLNTENIALKHRLEMATEREKRLQSLLTADGNTSDKGIGDQDTVHHLKEMQTLLRQHITENIHTSETVRELTQERRDLQTKIQQLENQIKLGGKHSLSVANLPEGVDQQVRFLYGRYMRMDSYRKALLWQKRYLMGVAAALDQWRTRLGDQGRPFRSKGWIRFKCVALTITAVFRMRFLVRRWHTGNRIGANIHLNIPNDYPTELRTSKSYTHVPTSSSYRPKIETHGRHSLNNPSSAYRIPSAKPSSWSIGSAVNVGQDRLVNRHSSGRQPVPLMTTQSTNVPYRNTPAYRESFGLYDMADQWHAPDSPRLRELHADLPEMQGEDHIYSPRSLTSDHEASSSPILSRYMDRVEQLNIKLQKALYTPRDPP